MKKSCKKFGEAVIPYTWKIDNNNRYLEESNSPWKIKGI